MISKKAAVTADVLDDWSNIKEKTIQTTEALVDAASHLKERAEEAFQESFASIRDKSADLPAALTRYVKKYPLKSLGFAALAGLFISKVL